MKKQYITPQTLTFAFAMNRALASSSIIETDNGDAETTIPDDGDLYEGDEWNSRRTKTVWDDEEDLNDRYGY